MARFSGCSRNPLRTAEPGVTHRRSVKHRNGPTGPNSVDPQVSARLRRDCAGRPFVPGGPCPLDPIRQAHRRDPERSTAPVGQLRTWHRARANSGLSHRVCRTIGSPLANVDVGPSTPELSRLVEPVGPDRPGPQVGSPYLRRRKRKGSPHSPTQRVLGRRRRWSEGPPIGSRAISWTCAGAS